MCPCFHSYNKFESFEHKDYGLFICASSSESNRIHLRSMCSINICRVNQYVSEWMNVSFRMEFNYGAANKGYFDI